MKQARPFRLLSLTKPGVAHAQEVVAEHHYLHRSVDVRCSVEGYGVEMYGIGFIGYLIFGRPEATRCKDWYGSVEDVSQGRCGVTRWQVLNLARVWLDPDVQPGGYWYFPEILPGFIDRKGQWRSNLASEILRIAIKLI